MRKWRIEKFWTLLIVNLYPDFHQPIAQIRYTTKAVADSMTMFYCNPIHHTDWIDFSFFNNQRRLFTKSEVKNWTRLQPHAQLHCAIVRSLQQWTSITTPPRNRSVRKLRMYGERRRRIWKRLGVWNKRLRSRIWTLFKLPLFDLKRTNFPVFGWFSRSLRALLYCVLTVLPGLVGSTIKTMAVLW